jgi:hypothetical protein
MDCAGAALRDAAAEFCPRHAENVTGDSHHSLKRSMDHFAGLDVSVKDTSRVIE